MKDPFELVTWAVAIVVAWMILSTTGLDDWLKKLVGRKGIPEDLAAKIEALEKRIAQLEEDKRRREPLEAIRKG